MQIAFGNSWVIHEDEDICIFSYFETNLFWGNHILNRLDRSFHLSVCLSINGKQP